VATYYSSVPVRADKGCEPLDLMRSKRIRSTGTSSVKWIYPIRWIEIGRAGLEGKREWYLGFPGARRRRDLGQGVDLRRALVASGRWRIHDEV
jgi:hypothetical protein